jgi:hypothetical protein
MFVITYFLNQGLIDPPARRPYNHGAVGAVGGENQKGPVCSQVREG